MRSWQWCQALRRGAPGPTTQNSSRARASFWRKTMALNEFSTVLKAREFVRKANVSTIPVPLTAYLAEARATTRDDADMAADEAGMCMPMPNGTFRICVNANDSVERRRFSVCHEIGHIVLGLKSDH